VFFICDQPSKIRYELLRTVLTLVFVFQLIEIELSPDLNEIVLPCLLAEEFLLEH